MLIQLAGVMEIFLLDTVGGLTTLFLLLAGE